MKREKMLFTFFIIPFFLFPAEFKYIRLNKAKNPSPSISLQQTRFTNKDKTLNPKIEHFTLKQDPVKPKSALSKQDSKGILSDRRAEKTRGIPPVISDHSRPNRDRKRKPFNYRHQIKLINDGKPFSTIGGRYVPD